MRECQIMSQTKLLPCKIHVRKKRAYTHLISLGGSKSWHGGRATKMIAIDHHVEFILPSPWTTMRII